MQKSVFTICLSLFLFNAVTNGQPIDSVSAVNDTVLNSTSFSKRKSVSTYNNILAKNVLVNTKGQSVSFIQARRNISSKDILFYVLASILFLFAVLKIVYSRYLTNLSRVFFNTSLRQGQLIDQLVLARLPSLFFNFFFVIIGGWYLYLLLNYFGTITYKNWHAAIVCILTLAIIYTIKFFILKFGGWVSGYKKEADMYLFIVFLLNKIIAVCLIPVVIIISFSPTTLVNGAVVGSYILIAFMLLLRFFRSYGLFENKINVNKLHFFLYIIGIEILPLVMLYKGALIILAKNM